MVEAQPPVRYWILHGLRVALWPMPIVTLFKAARVAVNTAPLAQSAGAMNTSSVSTWGSGRAKNADTLDVTSRHPARRRFFSVVFRKLGWGAGKLGGGKDRRPTLRG